MCKSCCHSSKEHSINANLHNGTIIVSLTQAYTHTHKTKRILRHTKITALLGKLACKSKVCVVYLARIIFFFTSLFTSFCFLLVFPWQFGRFVLLYFCLTFAYLCLCFRVCAQQKSKIALSHRHLQRIKIATATTNGRCPSKCCNGVYSV